MKFNLAIVGATGLVGRKFLEVLEESFLKKNIQNIYFFASAKSVEQKISFCGKKYQVEELCEKNIVNKKIDYAFFSAGESVSKKFVKIFNDNNCVVIDNSSAFRMEKSVPLIVPEINFELNNSRLIANPNCSTIQVVLPVYYLSKIAQIKEISYTSFQAVSGSGNKGLNDLKLTSQGELPEFYPYSIYDNCLPQIGSFNDNGFTSEEMKMINETRKILDNTNLKISATCVRVPVENCHAVSVSVKLTKPININDFKEVLKSSAGVVLCDDITNNIYPINQVANGKDDVFVGRLRLDLFNKNMLHFYCVADNLRRGAASNAVKILEKIIKKH